jgi:TonB family protein
MTRLEKKCIIASAGLHLTLAVLLIVGPGFLSSNSKPDNLQILDFIPPTAIPGDATGGGGPRMRPPGPVTPVAQPPAEPPAQPPQQVVTPTPPAPKPPPVKVEQPEPPKVTKINPEALTPIKEPKHKIVVNTQIVTGSEKDSKDARETKSAADKAAARRAAAQRQLAAALGRAQRDLKTGFSGGTDVKFNDGFGGSGPAYANWLQIIKSIYFNDWSQRVPDGATDDSAFAIVTVTIARDGTVLNSEIRQTSGSAAVDRSIQATLDRVKFTAPFPETSKEEKTTLEITFSVKAVKQLIG